MLGRFGKNISLLAALPITTAIGSTGTTAATGLGGVTALQAQAKFAYGSGGTTVKCYVQTSLDSGVTWIDIACFAFTTASLTKVSALTTAIAPAAQAAAPTDGTLADNTVLNGVLGDRFRLKYVTTGTYAGGTTLTVDIVVKG